MDEVEYLNSRTGLPRCKASRLLPPRSGLERSDFVLWPISDQAADAHNIRQMRWRMTPGDISSRRLKTCKTTESESGYKLSAAGPLRDVSRNSLYFDRVTDGSRGDLGGSIRISSSVAAPVG